MKYEFDVAVIGTGSAGMSAYKAAKREGKRACLIESGVYGTKCASYGCMPSKLLISAAESAHNAITSSHFGIKVDGIQIDRSAVMQRVRRERERFVNFVKDDVHDFPKEDKRLGSYHFIDDYTLINENNQEKITAKTFVIATGTKPYVLPIFESLEKEGLAFDTEMFFNLHRLPNSIAIVGSGVIGLELGQALTRLGVKTTIFGIQNLVGGLTDPVILEKANHIFKDELKLYNNSEIVNVGSVKEEYQDKQSMITWRENGQQFSDSFEHVLLATGTKPNVESLKLENTSLQLDQNKLPVWDLNTLECLRTDQEPSNIFIAGDVTGERQILHEAIWEGQHAGKNAANYLKIENRKIRTPFSVMFTDPQVAMVGQRYVDLKEKSFVIGSVNFENQGRSRIIRKNKGTLHLYFSIETQEFLGAEMCGPAAEHLGHLLTWSHQMDLTLDQMLAMPFYHPVIEESIRTALRDAKAQLESF